MKVTPFDRVKLKFKVISTLGFLKYLFGSLFVTSVLMASSGVGLKSSLLLSLVIIAQWVPGALLWKWISVKRRLSFTELLGMGLAIGTLLALLSSQLFRITQVGRFAWAIPFLISLPLVIWTWFSGRSMTIGEKTELSDKHLIKSFLPAFVLGVIQLSVWWRWHPLKWSGWWKYNGDVPYFESYSNSLAILGTTQSLMDPTLDTRYHWFAYAWVGSLTNSLQIDSFVVLTRLLPIVAMTMGAAIVYSWAASMSMKIWIPGLAALIVVIGPGLSIGSLVMLRSPSSAMSVGWSLAFTVLLFKIVHERLRQPIAYLILALLAIGVVGGKAINIVLISFALLFLLFTSFTQTSEIKNRIWRAGALSLISLTSTFVLLIATSQPRTLDFGIFLGWPGLALTVLPTTAGIYGFYSGKHSLGQPLFVYSLGIILAGLLLSLVTSDRGGNQIYFLVSAATILVVPSLIGLEKCAPLLNLGGKVEKRAKIKLGMVVIFAGTLSSLLWMLFENSTSGLGKLGRTVAPLPIWVLSFLITFLLAKNAPYIFKTKRKQASIFLGVVMLASIVSSSLTIVSSIVNGPIYAGSTGISGNGKSTKNHPGSISYDYVIAGKWVQRKTPPEAIFFTNRQCGDATSSSENCDGLWTFASALSKRQYIIEGGGYFNLDKARALIRSDNQQLSIRFSISPNQEDWEELWTKGVRWGWIDRQVSSRTDWGKFANEVYSNTNIAVIKLLEP